MDNTPSPQHPEVTMANQLRDQARNAEKLSRAYELLLAGHSYQEIADEVGWANRSNAHNALKAHIRTRVAERNDLADEALVMMLDQLDGLIRAVYQKALDGDLQAHDRALRTLQQKAKLLEMGGATIEVTTETSITSPDLDRELAIMARVLTGEAVRKGLDIPNLPAILALTGQTVEGEVQS